MDRHTLALEKLRKGTVIPAIPLALGEKNQIDEPTQRKMIRYYLAAGAGGIASAVHSTQFAIRDPKYGLFEPVLRITAEELRKFEQKSGEITVGIAGACGPTDQACREAELIKKYGFDAVLLSPGGLNDWSEAMLLDRARKVAEIMPVVGFYLQDAVGGRQLSRRFWHDMAEIPNVVAIKCACFDRYRTAELVMGVMESSRRDEVTLYTGNDDHIIMDLLTPFTCVQNHIKYTKYFEGGLLGQWSVWTHTAVEIFKRCKECHVSGTIPVDLMELAGQLTECNGAVFDAEHRFAGCIPGIHYCLKRQGLMKSTRCLNPDEKLSDGQTEKIERVCKDYPYITDDEFVSEFLKK